MENLFIKISLLFAGICAYLFKKVKKLQWSKRTKPEFFNHYIDHYFQFPKQKSCFYMERGIFNRLCLKKGQTLDLCCGDGFFSKYFYSTASESVIACDFDEAAIKFAKKYNSSENVFYKNIDIRKSLPFASFDNVIWDAAIEHFTPEETQNILIQIKILLGENGILSGYTIVEKPGEVQLDHHEYEFKGKKDLLRVLQPHFKNVFVFETIHPGRHNLYFQATQSILPFDSQSSLILRS